VEKEQLLLKLVQSVRKANMKILCEGIGRLPRSFEWRCQNRVKSTNLDHFWGIFGIFRGKGSPDGKSRNFLFTQHFVYSSSQTNFLYSSFSKSAQFGRESVWLKILSLEKGRTKFSFPYCYSFLLEHKIGNLKVVMNSFSSLLSMSRTKVSMVPKRFNSTSGKSWFLGLIVPELKVYKKG